jgi:hypothetical protein
MFSCFSKAKISPLKRQRITLESMQSVISPLVILDETNPIENEILEQHRLGILEVKKLLMIGHLAAKVSIQHHNYNDSKQQLRALKESYDAMMNTLKLQNSNDLEAQRQVYQELLNEIKQRHIEHLDVVKNDFINAKRQLESVSFNTQEVIEERAKLLAEHNTTILQERLKYMKQKEEDLLKQLSEAKAEKEQMHREFIKTIKDEDIAALQAQIAMLKGQNHTKGILGENAIKDHLSKIFPEYELLDKSGTTAESDLHLVRNSDNCFIAIESKNKKSITQQDVEKSIRDISNLKSKYGSRFVGYLFASLRSPNIPRKGIKFEYNDGIPTIWYGIENDEDSCKFQYLQSSLPVMIRLLYTVADVKPTGNALDNTQIQELLTLHIKRLEQNQKVISSMTQNIKAIQDTNNAMYSSVFEFMTSNGLNIESNSLKRKSSFDDNLHVCDTCKREFMRKCDLQRHKCK